MTPVLVSAPPMPPVCEREALRYAGCRNADASILSLLRSCAEEAAGQIAGKVCYMHVPVRIEAETCRFPGFQLRSSQLAKSLSGCTSALVFAATVGIGLDRLITRYGRVSPSRALMLQALGAERVEALCDAFCASFQEQTGLFLRPRFSPGYGDLPLETQRELFAQLDCPRKIGLTLNESFLMSPSKSVTAISGVTQMQAEKPDRCRTCGNDTCLFRSMP